MDVWETRNQFTMISVEAEDQNGRSGTKSYWSAGCWQILVLKAKRAEETNARQTLMQIHDLQCQIQHY